jgi:hypothetical protein
VGKHRSPEDAMARDVFLAKKQKKKLRKKKVSIFGDARTFSGAARTFSGAAYLRTLLFSDLTFYHRKQAWKAQTHQSYKDFINYNLQTFSSARV